MRETASNGALLELDLEAVVCALDVGWHPELGRPMREEQASRPGSAGGENSLVGAQVAARLTVVGALREGRLAHKESVTGELCEPLAWPAVTEYATETPSAERRNP